MKRATHQTLRSIAQKVVAPIAGAVVIAAVIGIAANAKTARDHRPRPQVDISALPGPSGTPPLAASGAPLGPLGAQVTSLPTGQWIQWAMRDPDGTVSGSPGAGWDVTTTESVVKVWLAADYLARNPNPTQYRLDQLRRMIRDSNDNDAQSIYISLGGKKSIIRMVDRCGLLNTTPVDSWWSRTQLSAVDTVALGACINTGQAAGAKWTPWLLSEMRQIRGEGKFGIVDGLPSTWDASVSFKNGWTAYEYFWTVNCLAVSTTGWVLAVLQRYPLQLGLGHGAKVCADIAAQLAVHMDAPH